MLPAHAVRADRMRLHVVPLDRTWLRDSAPIGVVGPDGAVSLVNWGFNGWAKYANFQLDQQIGAAIAGLTGLERLEPRRADTRDRIVLEGGGVDVNGSGLLLATEEWLLTNVQGRNPGLRREDYERIFREWLGARKTIRLDECFVVGETN